MDTDHTTPEEEKIVRNSIHASQVAMGDMHNYYDSQVLKDEAPKFELIELQGHLEHYTPPTFINEVKQQLKKNRVLILSGPDGFDREDFAMYVAALLQSEEEEYETLELKNNIEDENIVRVIRDLEDASILILNRIHPRHIGHNFETFLKEMIEGGHYAVVTTEVLVKAWVLSENNIADHWFTVPDQIEYDSQVLLKLLLEGLQSLKYLLADRPEKVVSTSEMVEGITVNDVAGRLKHPGQVTLFLYYFSQLNSGFLPQELIDILRNLSDTDSKVLHRWFEGLSHQEKLIVLVALMMEGVYDDQFFGVISSVCESTFWQKSAGELQTIDYFQIEFIKHFFRFEEFGDGFIIYGKRNHLRRTMFETVWSSYRRHIRVLLNTLLQLTTDSYKHSVNNWDLYGTPERRTIIRIAFGNMLSEMGLISWESVKGLYYELILSGNGYYRAIAARAMARWRGTGNDTAFFALLKQWQTEEFTSSNVRHLFKRRKLILLDDTPEHPDVLVAQTAILCIGYAAEYDRPNQLSEELIEGLKFFVNQDEVNVQESLKKAMPKILRTNVLQLRHILLDDFMKHDYMVEPVSLAFAEAYTYHPGLIKDSLSSWQKFALETASSDNRRQKTTKRDNALATVLKTLRFIDYSIDGEDTISLSSSYEFCIELLRQEGREAVRKAVLQLLAFLLCIDFDAGMSTVDMMKSFLSEKDGSWLVNEWGSIYRQQRFEQTEAPHTLEIQGEYLPVWEYTDDRPLTAIEEGMFLWLEKGSLELQKYAMLTFMEFSVTLEQEVSYLMPALREQLRLRRERAAQRKATPTPSGQPAESYTPVPAYLKKLPVWWRIRIFFMMMSRPTTEKQSLKYLLRSFISNYAYSNTDFHSMLYKWRRRDQVSIRSLAMKMQKFRR